MVVTDEGLNLSDKELRALLIIKLVFSDFQCYHSCKDCSFEDDDGYCKITGISVEIETLFEVVVL